MVKERAYELRNMSTENLKKHLDELKNELSVLRVAKVAGGAPAKIAKIRTFRKAIARTLTVVHGKNREEMREKYKDSKYKPLDLRRKQTRAIRRRLTNEQLKKRTLKVLKKQLNFPKRRFEVAN